MSLTDGVLPEPPPSGFEMVPESDFSVVFLNSSLLCWDKGWKRITWGISPGITLKGAVALNPCIEFFARPVRIQNEIKTPEGYEIVPENHWNDVPALGLKVWCGDRWSEILNCGEKAMINDWRHMVASPEYRVFARPLYNRIPDVIKAPVPPPGYELIPESEWSKANPHVVPPVVSMFTGCEHVWQYWSPDQKKWFLMEGDASSIENWRNVYGGHIKYFARPIPSKPAQKDVESASVQKSISWVLVPETEWNNWCPPDGWFQYRYQDSVWFNLPNRSNQSLLNIAADMMDIRKVGSENIQFRRPSEPYYNKTLKQSAAEKVRQDMVSLMGSDTCGTITGVSKWKDLTPDELAKLWKEDLQVKPACKDCRFVHVVQQEDEHFTLILECRRNTPLQGRSGSGRWAYVVPEDWCGEFQAKGKS